MFRNFAFAAHGALLPLHSNLASRVNHMMPSFKRILKAFYVDRVYYHYKEYVYFKKTFVVVAKDLSSLPPLGDALERAGVQAVRVTAGALAQDGNESVPPLRYLDDKRRKKGLNYLRKGYRGVALVNNGEVVGDIWYCGGRQDPGNRPIHPDLKVLQVSCGIHDAYGFDLYLCPDKRGKAWANLLQRAALNEMKNDGFTRALGYYYVKNLPALWVHRTLQWTEVQRVDVMRFYLFRHARVRSVRAANVSAPSTTVLDSDRAVASRGGPAATSAEGRYSTYLTEKRESGRDPQQRR